MHVALDGDKNTVEYTCTASAMSNTIINNPTELLSALVPLRACLGLRKHIRLVQLRHRIQVLLLVRQEGQEAACHLNRCRLSRQERCMVLFNRVVVERPGDMGCMSGENMPDAARLRV
jgi:hypothetical protein